MNFVGEIIFAISDLERLDIDLGHDFLPTRIIKRGDVIALGRKAPKNRWMHCVKFYGHDEFIKKLEEMVNILLNKIDVVNEYKRIYSEVSIDVFIRSPRAEIGYSISSALINSIALLNCNFNCSILSFGEISFEEE